MAGERDRNVEQGVELQRLLGVRLELLQSFVVLSEELHLGRASARLFLSQSGLSRRLMALEAQLQVPLFLRSSRRVELAVRGRVLLPHARCLLEEAGRTSIDLCAINRHYAK